ncbi:MAG TPA: hypothetical protein DEB09_05875 [Candidatus Magasanikbacteria bacterium]|nr:hypothetical protein [Candidatus Magasanikbacteria bacterium]
MTPKAPHLPNKTCRVDTYYRLQNVKWLLLFAGLAFVAGVSATMIVNAWVLPHYESIQFVQSNDLDGKRLNNNTPDLLVKSQAEQRLMNVYDKKKKVEGQYYNKNSFVAQSAVVSSDGWCVLFSSNYFLGQEKNWEIIDYVGNSYVIEKTVYDKTNKLLFLKIQANGLRVMSFANWQNFGLNTNVWSIDFGNEWKNNLVADFVPLADPVVGYYADRQYNFGLLNLTTPGSVLLDGNGQLLAFVNVGGQNLLPSWLVERGINSILETGKLQYLDVGWQGSLVYGVFGNNNSQPETGLYINILGEKSVDSAVQIGDVVLEIENQPIDKFTLAEQIWFAPKEFKITIWRDGVRQEVFAKKHYILAK